jgi:hypothetical protein
MHQTPLSCNYDRNGFGDQWKIPLVPSAASSTSTGSLGGWNLVAIQNNPQDECGPRRLVTKQLLHAVDRMEIRAHQDPGLILDLDNSDVQTKTQA